MSVNKQAIHQQIEERGKYSRIPNEIWDVEGISIYARTIWIYLNSRHPQWDGSIANLSRNLGFSLSSAKRAVDELEARGMIVTEKTKNGTNFNLRPSDEWALAPIEPSEQLSQNLPSAPIEPAAQFPKSSRPVQGEGAYKNLTLSSNTQHSSAALAAENRKVESGEFNFKDWEGEVEAELKEFLS